MAPKTIDARGRSCPEPVLLTKQALAENPQSLLVLVDGGTARDNVSRFAKNSGYKVAVAAQGEGFALTLDR